MEWLTESWLFNTSDGWLVLISGVLAVATGALAFVTWRTAKEAKSAADAAIRSAEIAEQDLKRRSTIVVIPSAKVKRTSHGMPQTFLVNFDNVSDQPVFGLWLEVFYTGRAKEEGTWEEKGVERNWQEYSSDEGMPVMLNGHQRGSVSIVLDDDLHRADQAGLIKVTHVHVTLSYTDAIGERYESTSELYVETGRYLWSHFKHGDEETWR